MRNGCHAEKRDRCFLREKFGNERAPTKQGLSGKQSILLAPHYPRAKEFWVVLLHPDLPLGQLGRPEGERFRGAGVELNDQATSDSD